jgi:prepilin-type N-terminal cleavage/methylation domain-containing protein
MSDARSNKKGFTLLEMAISLLILGLVVAGFTNIFGLLSETDHQKTERENMFLINKSLNMFLAVNSHLPCPDTVGDGVENRKVDGSCTASIGSLPYSDLGVKASDAWGNPYYYHIHPEATDVDAVYQICNEASVFGKSLDDTVDAPIGLDNLLLCEKTHLYYCRNDLSLSVDCSPQSIVKDNPVPITVEDPTTGTNVTVSLYQDPRPNVANVDGTTALLGDPIQSPPSAAPFFHLATPPVGVNAGASNLTVRNEADEVIAQGVVAVVLSWGVNGGEVNHTSCAGSLGAETINCNGDGTFVNTLTQENRDFLTWVTVNQAKVALIQTGELR